MRSSLPTTIKISQDISNECGVVMADPTQIHQVTMNLITNAYHAMVDSGGTLTITLKEKELTDVQHLPVVDLPEGKYISLEITDTGCGMDLKTREMICQLSKAFLDVIRKVQSKVVMTIPNLFSRHRRLFGRILQEFVTLLTALDCRFQFVVKVHGYLADWDKTSSIFAAIAADWR